MKIAKETEALFKAAVQHRRHSHSPYSHFAVGAAIQVRGRAQVVGGCNIENASFGATLCAERVALHSAVAQFGKVEFDALVVVTGELKATVPCALCLQTLAEFCSDDFIVFLGNESGILQRYTLRELLPHPFRQFAPDGEAAK